MWKKLYQAYKSGPVIWTARKLRTCMNWMTWQRKQPAWACVRRVTPWHARWPNMHALSSPTSFLAAPSRASERSPISTNMTPATTFLSQRLLTVAVRQELPVNPTHTFSRSWLMLHTTSLTHSKACALSSMVGCQVTAVQFDLLDLGLSA